MESAPPPDPPSYGATNIPLPDKHHMVIKHTMRDFIGLEKADAEARQAMMNFSYLSAIGNMDEAFKAIKLIKRLKEYFLWQIHETLCENTKYKTAGPTFYPTTPFHPFLPNRQPSSGGLFLSPITPDARSRRWRRYFFAKDYLKVSLLKILMQ